MSSILEGTISLYELNIRLTNPLYLFKKKMTSTVDSKPKAIQNGMPTSIPMGNKEKILLSAM